jgi:hypothetical protein
MAPQESKSVTLDDFRSGDPNQDLDALMELVSHYGTDQVQQFVDEYKDDIESLVSVFGMAALRFSVILDVDAYDRIRGLLDSAHQERLEKNYEIVKTAVGSISKTAAIERIFHSEDSSDYAASMEGSINRINRVEPKSTWFLDDGGVEPRIRFIFANYQFRQVLLDTTLDWDDIVFLASKLIEALRNDISRTEKYLAASERAYAHGALKTENFMKNYNNLRNAVMEIGEILPDESSKPGE